MVVLTDRQRGMVTAELAVSLLSLIAITAVLLFAVQVAGLRLRCSEAARVGARAAARGDDPAAVRRAVQQVLPQAAVDITSTDTSVEVSVQVTQVPIANLKLAKIVVGARSIAALEVTADAP